ncbi:hypothetical protein [Mucilaginibacter myungsuensis]|uniref:DUF4488 domain-containing protein n=1 Tax=Mucilaginibacter myungsuensis TaxID=649104 RepID=A0A929KTJ2_9SPHI|nr:hypothetical protein [Mucilaginibacter myungsuensis]MBE9661301.1 hypothetical protein [Mucilaginibacter myungsuensis]MDN3597444.1 hypothetical protein [Mucilaginibacter myungsuensis]
MKTILKTFILFSFLYISNIASAQVSKKDFVGIWEFVQFGADPNNLGPSARGVLTIRTDTSFTIVRQSGQGAVITQSGTYKVADDKFFVQKKTYQMPALGNEGVGQEDKLTYWFSEDKKALRYSYALASGEVYYEVWRRL